MFLSLGGEPTSATILRATRVSGEEVAGECFPPWGGEPTSATILRAERVFGEEVAEAGFPPWREEPTSATILQAAANCWGVDNCGGSCRVVSLLAVTGKSGNTVATILRTPVSAENNDFSGKDDENIGTCFLSFVGLSDPTGGTDNVSVTNLRVLGGVRSDWCRVHFHGERGR